MASDTRCHTTSEPMPERTLTALRGSIKKWEGIVAGTIEDKGPDNCPLCQLFIDNDECAGCPVAAFTGEDGCGDTPYEDYSAAQSRGDSNRIARAAQAEVAFLKSLLPTDAIPDETNLTGEQRS